MNPERLPAGPFEVLDRARRVEFLFEGRTLEGFEGDTIGSALLAAGVEVLARSFKYHRPRGLFCVQGACPNCLVTVDDVPNVRACTEPLRPGISVRRQNAWPSVDRDLLAVADRLSFLLPPGFYYKLFQRPRWAWPLVEPWIRRAAGLGRVPPVREGARATTRTWHPDVLVVGAGPAGLAAAAEAARAGAETLVLEAGDAPGGHLLGWIRPVRVGSAELDGRPGQEIARRLAEEAEAAGARILLRTLAFGVFDGPVVAAVDDLGLLRIRPRTTIFATGALEQPVVFLDNDRPGVLLASGADRLVHRHRVLPGKRVVVLAAGPRAYPTAAGLAEAGARVLVIDPGEPPVGPDLEGIVGDGVRVLPATRVVATLGRRCVDGVVVREPSGERRIACDALVIAGALAPVAGLLGQAGVRLGIGVGAGDPEGALAAGHVRGSVTLEEVVEDGRRAGLEAARGGAGRRGGSAGAPRRVRTPTPHVPGEGKRFACLCMDVTDHELRAAVAEGFDSLELLKRYTTITMGPCQGRSCLTASAELFAEITGRSLDDLEPTTSRPPAGPVSLGALAGDRRLEPRKETPLHHLHERLGATFLWAGEWRRPYGYGDPEAEVRAVRERVGMIDVSTLGKFLIRGPDAVAFLERLYPSRIEDQPVGRIRYGVMVNEEGVIIDDGAIGRLSDDAFYVTATTGNAAAIDRWISSWQAVWDLRVVVWNVTGGYAAINVAGPRAREVLAPLCDGDAGLEDLPHLGVRSTTIAGVPAILLRLGFVGELAFEVHVPAGAAQHVWEAILRSGAEAGIAPFGLEAQRILRLEKGHILVGQDTDAETDPFSCGLGRLVRFDGRDFLGRAALELRAARPSEKRLVGFVVDGSVVPAEGSAVVERGRPAGRVTSCRRSPTLGKVIGLAWVPAERAEPGTPIEIRAGERSVTGTVAATPFYDPEGRRLRG